MVSHTSWRHQLADGAADATAGTAKAGTDLVVRPGLRQWCGMPPRSVAVEAQGGVVQPDSLARARAEGRVVELLVARHGVHRRLGLLGRLHLDVAVAGQARAGGDELTEDDVLLEAEQRVGLGLDGRVREDPRRLLEGRRREPGLRGQRGLGDAHELRTTGGGLASLGQHPTVLGLEATTLGQLAREQLGVAGLDDRHPTQHLADDDLDVLVVDRHTLLAVDRLDLVDQVHLHRAGAEDAQDLLGVDRTLDQLGADGHVVAVRDQQARALADRVGVLVGAVVRHQHDAAGLVGVLHADPAGGLGDRGHTLGGAGLEQLDHTGQTLRDVVTGHTTGVEGPHRQLGAGLTDGLGGDDADRLTDVDQLAGGQRAAVARSAGADLGVTGQHRTDPHLLDAGGDQRVDDHVTEVDAGEREGLPLVHDVLGQGAGVDAGLHVLVLAQGAIGALDRDRHGQATVGAAVVLADDDVLADVHQTTGQVTRVGGTQRGVGQTLTGTVRGDEERQHGHALTEVRLDRARDDVTLRVRHQTTHTGDLPQLHPVTTGTRGDHPEDRVGLGEVALHLLGDLVRGLRPDLDELLSTLVVGDQTALVLRLHLGGLGLVALEDLDLARRRDHVGDRHGRARAGRPVETGLLQGVQGRRDLHLGVALSEVVDDGRQGLLVDGGVDEGVVQRQGVVEQRATERGLDRERRHAAVLGGLDTLGQRGAQRRDDVHHPDLDPAAELQLAGVEGHAGLGHGGERAPGALAVLHLGGEVEQADDHVLGGHGHRTAVGRLEDVVAREHQDARLGLGLGGQRHVHGHLVTVEVGVEGRADERVDLDGLALDQLRLEGLDAEAVQRGRTVQQHRVLGDDLFEDVPDHGAGPLDHALGRLDVLRVVEVDQALHHERLEQLQRHLLGQAALVQLELRADDDDRTAGVVDALAQQVLTETTLLALEHVGQRLERTVAGARDRAATTAVVEEAVDGLLEHALLVVDDDLGGTEVEEALQAVVAVDDAPVEVVEVRGREAATVELHHGAQVRGDDRDRVEDHARRVVRRHLEGVDDLESLDGTGLLLALAGGDDLLEEVRLRVEVEGLEALLDRRGAHAALEVEPEAVPHLAVEDLVALEVLALEVLEPVPDLLEPLDLLVGALADLVHLAVRRLADLAARVSLGTLGLELGDVGLETLGACLDLGVAAVLDLLLLDLDLRLERRQVSVTLVLVDGRDHVGREVDDLLEVLRGEVEQVAEAARDTLEVPDVGDGGGELDVAHPLTSHLGARDLDATALTDDALEADALVLAAVALPVPGGAEDALAEQALLLGLERAVVDGLGLLDLAVAPLADGFRGGEADAQLVEEVDVEHVVPSLVTLVKSLV